MTMTFYSIDMSSIGIWWQWWKNGSPSSCSLRHPGHRRRRRQHDGCRLFGIQFRRRRRFHSLQRPEDFQFKLEKKFLQVRQISFPFCWKSSHQFFLVLRNRVNVFRIRISRQFFFDGLADVSEVTKKFVELWKRILGLKEQLGVKAMSHMMKNRFLF